MSMRKWKSKSTDNYLIRDRQDMLILGSEDASTATKAITKYLKNRSKSSVDRAPRERLYAELVE